MWQEVVACSSQYNVAFCLPFEIGGSYFPIYWYGILAAIGIIVGAMYAQHHMELEGGDPELVWDALIFMLPAGLIGGRLWFVAQNVIAGTEVYSSVLDVFNPRLGGMNIFGGVIFGVIALVIFIKVRDIDGWLLTDASLMGLLLGQGIGRFGNLINRELYGPPTNSEWFGIQIPPGPARLPAFAGAPPGTRFHPTMLYEAFWLFLVFGLIYVVFRRNQAQIVHGLVSGAYFVLAGLGRFVIEQWRPDQSVLEYNGVPIAMGNFFELTYGRVWALLFILMGLIVILDRNELVKIPGSQRPPTPKERERAFADSQRNRRRRDRMRERERAREERRKERREVHETE